ncbi:MAG: class I SAM-dependent methyltransferase [Bryobacteraceae bacterium]
MSLRTAVDVQEERLTAQRSPCPNCRTGTLEPFYEVRGVPVHSVVNIRTREEALAFPKGDIALAWCEGCGFVSNTAYDSSLQEYCSDCEETQGYSDTFQLFQEQLAERLVKRHSLFGKRIVEVGCGKGEFLSLLCKLGGNSGVGFDPAFVPERNPAEGQANVEFVQAFYSEQNAVGDADFLCCKMTLEHIADTHAFVSMVRRSIGSRRTPVFFQVPDFRRILTDNAFWDVYYEHCSYFTKHALSQLFQRAGFEIVDIRSEYDGQYLAIEAVPAEKPMGRLKEDPWLEWTSERIRNFSSVVAETIASWNQRIASRVTAGENLVIWGSGSKGVSFLTSLRNPGDIRAAVDINPHRQGTFMAGTGHPVVAPEQLQQSPPDLVIVMNPIYAKEIATTLQTLGLHSKLWCV